MNWAHRAQRLHQEAYVLYFVFKHPRTRWYVRLIAAFPVAYLFSPIQLIPNFIPVIGFLDDFLVLVVGAKLIRKLSPSGLLLECCALANIAQNRNEKEENTKFAVIGIEIILMAASFLAAAAASAAVVAYIHS